MVQERMAREHMEDVVAYGTVHERQVLGVFDGHGGHEVAEHAAAQLLAAVEAEGVEPIDEAAMARIFGRIDLPTVQAGSTATVVIIGAEDVRVGWVGDSSAVLVRNPMLPVHELTSMHRADREDELARIYARGGGLMDGYVYDPHGDRCLMVTRALGDADMRRVGVIPTPEFRLAPRRKDDYGVVLATDGLWDVVTAAEAAQAVRLCPTDADKVARGLVDRARRKMTGDNTTVLVGLFQ